MQTMCISNLSTKPAVDNDVKVQLHTNVHRRKWDTDSHIRACFE